MRCEYRDGVRIDYPGTLRISKGDQVDYVINQEAIPSNYRDVLDWALHSHNCGDIRKYAEEIAHEVGTKRVVE